MSSPLGKVNSSRSSRMPASVWFTAFMLVIVVSTSTSTATTSLIHQLPSAVKIVSNEKVSVRAEYGFHWESRTLFVVVRCAVLDEARTPGWIAVGLRDPNTFSGPGMGHADIFQSYFDEEGGRCVVEGYSPGVNTVLRGRRAGRLWNMVYSELEVKDGNMTFGAVFSLLPVTTSGSIEFLVALGDQRTLMFERVCPLQQYHNLVASTVNLTLCESADFQFPQLSNCFSGIAHDNISNCVACYGEYAGPKCDIKCACSSQRGKCDTVTGVCVSCLPGYYDINCAKECNCTEGQGTCDDGISGTGACSCLPGFAGDKCGDCDTAHYGSKCSLRCLCQSGICNHGMDGSGKCSACFPGYGGILCNKSCGECNASSYCSEGIFGDGECHLNEQTNNDPFDGGDGGSDANQSASYKLPNSTTTAPAATTVAPPTDGLPPEAEAPVERVYFLTLVMRGDIAEFNETKFKIVLANAINVGLSDINIISIRQGSVVLSFSFVGMTSTAAQTKYSLVTQLVHDQSAALDELQILSLSKSSVPLAPPPPTTEPPTTPRGSNAVEANLPTEDPEETKAVAGLEDGFVDNSTHGATYIIVGASFAAIVAISLTAFVVYLIKKSSNSNSNLKSDTENGSESDNDDEPHVASVAHKYEKTEDEEQLHQEEEIEEMDYGPEAVMHPLGQPKYAFGSFSVEERDKIGKTKQKKKIDVEPSQSGESSPSSPSFCAMAKRRASVGLEESYSSSQQQPQPKKTQDVENNKEILGVGAQVKQTLISPPPTINTSGEQQATTATTTTTTATTTSNNNSRRLSAVGIISDAPSPVASPPPPPPQERNPSSPRRLVLRRKQANNRKQQQRAMGGEEVEGQPVANRVALNLSDDSPSLHHGPEHTRTVSTISATETATSGGGARKTKKHKLCHFCGAPFDEAEEECAVAKRPHRIILEEKKAEKKMKKELRRKIFETVAQQQQQEQEQEQGEN